MGKFWISQRDQCRSDGGSWRSHGENEEVAAMAVMTRAQQAKVDEGLGWSGESDQLKARTRRRGDEIGGGSMTWWKAPARSDDNNGGPRPRARARRQGR